VLLLTAVAAAVPAVLVNVSRGSSSSAPPKPAAFVPLTTSPLPGARLFDTEVPGSWSNSMSFPGDGVTDYSIASSPMPLNDVLPPPGTIEIQIQYFPPATVAGAINRRAVTQSPRQLLMWGHLPKGSARVVRTPARSVLVGGQPAAERTSTFVYHGQSDIQTELVTRHAGEVISVEMDNKPSLETKAATELRSITGHWKWLTSATAVRPPKLPDIHLPPTGPPPNGQWIASGFDDYVSGGVANARLNQAEVRAWDFTRSCAAAQSCHVTLTHQLMYGGTQTGRLALVPNDAWWHVTFPVVHTLCARRPGRRTLHESIRDTIRIGWESSAHRVLIADETQTIGGCGDPTPASVADHWTVTAVARPAGVPDLSLNPTHAVSMRAFRAAAGSVCSRVSGRAGHLAGEIETALSRASTSSSATARAVAQASVVHSLTSLLALTATRYTQTPQPPSGSLEAWWLQDLAAIREQIASGAAANSAIESSARAMARYRHTGQQLQLQNALTEVTFASEDLGQLATPAITSKLLERALALPAACAGAPSIYSVFSKPSAR
jgi:hypothetical protein